MKKKNATTRYSLDAFIKKSRASKTDWTRALTLSSEEAEVRALADVDDFTNDSDFWRNAQLVYPVPKEKISLRLDRDVLKHFRKRGRGYQSLINAVLRAYVMREPHQPTPSGHSGARKI